ncbi:hypothetical protein JIR23_08730 [Bradyrhizobium diazoefficiens]|nr:hypothetical protein [Bradyrhizobium diazoefficiens]QQN65754.1 hypothetical protein JIR23_08730 [Bradyrhizobium diazoefficiens]
MTEPKKDAPRRYILDGAGQRVIVGLTISETIEFEMLDNPDTRSGDPDPRGEACYVHQGDRAGRWLELYLKHERAWSRWMAETGARLQTPPLLN